MFDPDKKTNNSYILGNAIFRKRTKEPSIYIPSQNWATKEEIARSRVGSKFHEGDMDFKFKKTMVNEKSKVTEE